MVKFNVEPFKIEASIESAKKVFRDAVGCLTQEMPRANTDCEYCGLVLSRKKEG